MKKNKGFTLIEILVMLTIVSVLSVTSLVAYSKFTEESSMKQEVLHIVDTIELAKSNARGKRLASDCITILSYDFIVSSNNKYSTALRCNSASGIHEVPFEEITIKPIYSLSYNSSNQLRVYFPIDGMDISRSSSSSNISDLTTQISLTSSEVIQLKLQQNNTNYCGFIAINSVGVVKYQIGSCSLSAITF